MRIKIVLLFGLLLTFAPPSFSQTPPAGTIVSSSTRIVKNAPYSAEITTETVRLLSDGNKITRTDKRYEYRDGEGRTRREQEMVASGFSPDFIALRETVTITDPIAGFVYYLNTTAKTARRQPIAAPVVRPPAAAPVGYSTKSEQLGTQVIEGLEATGTKFVMTIAAGAIGNQNAIETVTENWFSPELKILLLSKRTDPQYGDVITKATNIKRAEPEKSLFVIPADYEILKILATQTIKIP